MLGNHQALLEEYDEYDEYGEDPELLYSNNSLPYTSTGKSNMLWQYVLAATTRPNSNQIVIGIDTEASVPAIAPQEIAPEDPDMPKPTTDMEMPKPCIICNAYRCSHLLIK